jgi:hypothetical protein
MIIECPIHHIKFDEYLWCPLCLEDEQGEYEEYEKLTQEQEEKSTR